MNTSPSRTVSRVVLAVGLVMFGFGGAQGQSWTYSNGVLTGADGLSFSGSKPVFGSGNTAFYLGCQALTTAYFFPMGDQSWVDYINSADCSLVNLTAAEKRTFKTLYPNFRHTPKQKVQMQKNGPYEYVCFWHPIPPGLMLLVRRDNGIIAA